ncbi:MAG: HAMP domain-containing histidine kinase [Deltaproteobacteria bacterium]|nr:HAMP domain-containing histidine kinase [Deltaproteobacteria bacterium]
MANDPEQRTRGSTTPGYQTGNPRKAGTPSELDPSLIAGDLRFPVSAILAEIARVDHLGEKSAVVRRALERIAHSAAIVDRMASDLFDFANAEAGQFNLRLEPTDLAHLLSSAIERTTPRQDRPRVAIEIRDVPTARVDAARLERVIANVMQHSLNAGPRTSPVSIRVETRHHRATLTFTDASTGMTSDQVATLFDRHRTCPHPCVGMGLYVGRRIVEAHGGRMLVDNTPGKCCRITIELPVS